jgi:uncharacterized protein
MDCKQAFLAAVKKGDLAGVQDLLEQDSSLAATADENGVSALLLACYYRKPDIVAELLRLDVERNVFEASATGQTERLRVLLAKQPSLANAFAADGFTPLGLAAFFGQRKAVEILLATGAQVNVAARNSMKVAPLHSAAAADQTEIARLLLEHGADVNARQQAGVTPLHQAAAAGQLGLAELLLDHGADVNARTDDGATPLGLAVKNQREKLVTLLRQQGGVE